MNTELFGKIDEVLTEHPEKHNQESWEGYCGTSRCVAGWAIHLVTGKPLYAQPGGTVCHPSVAVLAGGLGVTSISGVAGKLLDLNERERYALFNYADNDEAREAVAAGAAGDRERFTQAIDRVWARVGERG